MAQWVKEFATKPDKPELYPRTHNGGGETVPESFHLPHVPWDVHACISTLMK